MSTDAEQIITHDEALRRGRWVAAYTDADGKECRVHIELGDGLPEAISSRPVKRLNVRNFRYLAAE